MNKHPRMDDLRSIKFPWDENPPDKMPVMKMLVETYVKDFIPDDVTPDFFVGTQWMMGMILGLLEAGFPLSKGLLLESALALAYYWDFEVNPFNAMDDFEEKIRPKLNEETERIIEQFMARIRKENNEREEI